MNEKEINDYYNKFNEDKRLKTRHGEIEFFVVTNYIDKYLKKGDKIIDIGAGCGAYSKYYFNKGYDVTAVELVKHNLREIEKETGIKCYNLNAIDLKGIKDNYYDIVLLFGPMYHLLTEKEKEKALEEAKRVCKKGGIIFISYTLKNFAILKHGFIDNNILDELDKGNIDSSFDTVKDNDKLYSFVSLNYIKKLRCKENLTELELVSEEGPTEYMRNIINKMDDKTFDLYKKYILKISSDKSMLGLSRHALDIVKKESN